MRQRPWILVATVLALIGVGVLVWAFASSNGKKKPSAAAWAADVCSAITTWKSDLNSAVDSVKANPSKDSAQKAVDDAKKSTSTLKSTLSGLGTPDVQSVDTAESALDKLESELQQGVSSIQADVSSVSGLSDLPAAVSKVSATISTMSGQLSATVDTLRTLPAGELQQAFKNAPECKGLTG